MVILIAKLSEKVSLTKMTSYRISATRVEWLYWLKNCPDFIKLVFYFCRLKIPFCYFWELLNLCLWIIPRPQHSMDQGCSTPVLLKKRTFWSVLERFALLEYFFISFELLFEWLDKLLLLLFSKPSTSQATEAIYSTNQFQRSTVTC